MLTKNQTATSTPNKTAENKDFVIEFIGVFALTYIGSWAIIYNDIFTLSTNGVALAHALVLLVFMRFAIPISGAHFNPAITLSLVLTKKIDMTTGTFYIMSQFVGAVVAAGFIFIQMNTDISEKVKNRSALGIPHPGSRDYKVSGFWGEAIGSFFMMYAYMALIADAKKNRTEGIGAAAFALVVYICIMTLGEISGAGLNPARSLAPAIVIGQFGKIQFVQFFGPIIGCLLSTVIYNSIYVDDEEDLQDPVLRQEVSDEKKQILSANSNAPLQEFELKETNK